MRVAIVTGAGGRVGSAFALRLARDGFAVIPIGPEQDGLMIEIPDGPLYLFECAYDGSRLQDHVMAAARAMHAWRDYAGIFMPSSDWIGTDSPYGRAKLVIEQLAAFHRSMGACIVTDRIGYFPGDGVAPDATEPMLDRLVTGEILYARVMEKML